MRKGQSIQQKARAGPLARAPRLPARRTPAQAGLCAGAWAASPQLHPDYSRGPGLPTAPGSSPDPQPHRGPF